MRLLKAIIISISILFYGINAYADTRPKEINDTIGEMPDPIWLGDDLKYSMPAFLWRHTQYLNFRLTKDEKKLHQSAVFFMLKNTENGEIVSWYSDTRKANGKVRVIHSYPISGGYCRTYQSFIKVKTKSKHTTNNACRYRGSPSWSFYK